jgi:hypothetical protein
MFNRLFLSKWILYLLGSLIALWFLAVPTDLLAIHAILKDGEPIPREHGRVALGMPLPKFLQLTKGIEEPSAIGQFNHERRFIVIDASSFSSEVRNVICDFYKGILFRIEINYRPIQKSASPVQDLKEKWSHRFGDPRINSFAGAHILFWDDGKTRLILEEDEEERVSTYSATYIDDDLFHAASRDRVQLETEGKSSYGK